MSISSYFEPGVALKSQNTPKRGRKFYIVSLYTYVRQTGGMERDNLLSFTIFKDFRGFSIFLGLFTSISSYFDPEVALRSQNTPNSVG